MTTRRAKPPSTQRRFTSPWSELAYLCKKLHYWLYVRRERARAQRFLPRLKKVLSKVPQNDEAIVRQEGFALLYELAGDTARAIEHREREIRLNERLLRGAGSVSADVRDYMLQGRTPAELSERRAILASLRSATPVQTSVIHSVRTA
jgi:hypothetical protein